VFPCDCPVNQLKNSSVKILLSTNGGKIDAKFEIRKQAEIIPCRKGFNKRIVQLFALQGRQIHQWFLEYYSPSGSAVQSPCTDN
jgi:hypothetical protein